MRRSLLLLALCSCTDDSGGGGGIDGTTHVETYELPAAIPPKLDLLFVIDDTSAMASHQQALGALPMQLEQTLQGAYASVANYHIGVVTTSDANLRRSTAIPDPFIVHDNTFSGPANNYQGSLASALASLLPGAAATTANQPLATMQAALGSNPANAGFLRGEAYLGVITISASDDASAGGIIDYASALKATKSDPLNVVLSGVFDPNNPRLGAFHAQFPNRSDMETIASGDYVGALEIFTQLYRSVLGYACRNEPADLDPDLPGPQYDCSFVSIDGGVEKLLPQCGTSVTQPCWEIVAGDASICTDPAMRSHLQTRGYTTSMSAYGDPFHPAIRGQCIVN